MSSSPMYLRASDGIDVFIQPYAPTFVSGGERILIFDGKRGFVSQDNFNWMKTATPNELGGMRVMRITSTAAKNFLPKQPKIEESFRYQP